MKIASAALLSGACLLLKAAPAVAQQGVDPPLPAEQDLSSLSIEQLAQVTVRSASKSEEPLSQVPSALYVVTGDEILENAAHSIPEALRLAPNLWVQQVDARQYAITARGFNSVETANKLLVLIDGRSVYSPLASTVYWELHNRPVEDIDQIEVISGPGGTLYGPNAVNGVVNIITRDARETLGSMVRGTVGEDERSLVLRYGAALGSGGAVRAYASLFERDALRAGTGPEIDDRQEGLQFGFRADFESGSDQFTFQGDLFDTQVHSLPGDGEAGHNFLARWTHRTSANSSFQVQAYYDWFERELVLTRDRLQTLDLSVQHNRRSGRHELVMGAGIRTTHDQFINNLNSFVLDPQSRRLWVYNAFVQDRIALTPALSLILGVKAEETSFTGVEFLPNARLAWRPAANHLIWAAVSRAIRSPSRIDRQLVSPPILAPGDDFVSEKLVAFEAGYRGQPSRRTSLSLNLFFNLYDDLRSAELAPGNMLPIRLGNAWQGHTYGVEVWSSTQALPWWRLGFGLATLWKNFELKAGRTDISAGDSLGHDPEYQLKARSQMALSKRLSFNLGLRWIGEIKAQPGIGDYVEADARLAYAVTDDLELYFAGRNLLHRTHAESDDDQRGQLAERSLFAGTRWRF